MNLTRMRALLVQIVALALAFVTGRLFFAFGRAVEPQAALLHDVVVATLFGLAAHLGLFLSADAASRPPWYRRLAFILMLPTSVVLVGSVLDTGGRLLAGNPPRASILLAYGVGLAVYTVQLAAILRGGMGRSRSATAA